MLDVTAVICTYNSQRNISRCIESLKENNVKEIIIVDGNSTDKTVDLIKGKVNKILFDHKTGLADARNLGIKEASCSFILNAGSDNFFPENSIKRMIEFYKKYDYKGISMLTKVDYTNNKYLAYCMNTYRSIRFKPGEAAVIGTPTLFESEIVKQNPYSSKSTHSDDEELCARLYQKFGYKFSISNIYCHESHSDYISEINDKWFRYGISDFEIYSRNKSSWTLKRKLKSIFYPLRVELILPISNSFKSVFILPFLIYITLIRYFSWLKCVLSNLNK